MNLNDLMLKTDSLGNRHAVVRIGNKLKTYISVDGGKTWELESETDLKEDEDEAEH